MFFIPALFTFVATELDDFALFVLLFARHKEKALHIFLGQFAALLIITLSCVFVSIPLSRIPQQYLRFAGLVPLGIGIKELIELAVKIAGRNKKLNDDENLTAEKTSSDKKNAAGIFITALLCTFSASFDNLGIYIPYFTDLSMSEKLATTACFMLFQCLWSLLQYKTCSLPVIKKVIDKSEDFLVPTVFILLGLSILL